MIMLAIVLVSMILNGAMSVISFCIPAVQRLWNPDLSSVSFFVGISVPTTIFVFLCTALTYFLTYRYLSANVRNIPFALVIFICMGGIQLHIDFVRSAVSAALFMYSIRYIEERKLKQFLLLNLVGLTFHVSALLYIPVYFLYGARISNKLLAGIGIAGALLQFLNIPLASYICIFIDKVFWGIDNVPFDLHEFSILPTIPIGAIERRPREAFFCFFIGEQPSGAIPTTIDFIWPCFSCITSCQPFCGISR